MIKRLKIIYLAPELLTDLLLGKAVATNLPNDAKLIEAQYNMMKGMYGTKFSSETFDIVPEGENAPIMNLITRSVEQIPFTENKELCQCGAIASNFIYTNDGSTVKAKFCDACFIQFQNTPRLDN